MCTLSFVTTKDGYVVAMNRDERLARGETALPPRVVGSALYPHEPGGGTWIGVRADGVTLALLNWTLRPGQSSGARSRGFIIPELLGKAEATPEGIPRRHLEQTAPFRLIGFFPALREVREWRWGGSHLGDLIFPWRMQHWFSSGAGDREAEAQRGGVTSAAAAVADAGSLAWLRRLHRSHEPERGAFSICAHRGIAGTLSYTEIEVGTEVRLRYQAGPPCSPLGEVVEVALPRSEL
jgi:hypothetical protein